MGSIISGQDAPRHLFTIPELDFSGDLFAERAAGPWFRLGARTLAPRCDERRVEDVVERQSLLLAPEQFARVFDKLQSVGSVLCDLGKPGESVYQSGQENVRSYSPFHRFEFLFASAVGEPLVFIRSTTTGAQLFVNPDLWMFFELEESPPGSGCWWDPRRGVDALLQQVIGQGNLQVVEIRIEYLLRYLQARQASLVVGHYRHLHLYCPPRATAEAFVEGNIVLGSPGQGAKAILQNWGPRSDIPGTAPFLQRRMHLWFEIKPPEFDGDDPWRERPPFDPYTFTLPTEVGPVAPARWKHFLPTEGRIFEGVTCDFMNPVYFRQEVLCKYEGASGFKVADNGSVSCHHYWGLVRSTVRYGNELLSTAIGDFAEGVPFEEWPHWKQYAVAPPSPESLAGITQEQSVPKAVNSLVKELEGLNGAFEEMTASLGVQVRGLLWSGSLDSLCGRQLKWVYPASADEDEFLKRATLASTLVIDGLEPRSLRTLLSRIGEGLDENDENPPKPLGSRNLLHRLVLAAALVEHIRPQLGVIAALVKQAQGRSGGQKDPDLQAELRELDRRVREELSPLVFLYELRTCGGLAHPPNKDKAAQAAGKLGLPQGEWRRIDYLHLLERVADSVHRASGHLSAAAEVMEYLGSSQSG